MIDRIDPKPADVVLDLAAGFGDTGFLAAQRVGDSGRIITSDFSPSMLEGAKRRADELGITNAEFRILEAENMDLADVSIDGALCRWGLMLMLDPSSALSETRRVLRPGGRFAFAVWGAPEANPWITLPGMVMVTRGLLDMPPPDAPGGIFSMADPARVNGLVRGAGFEDLEFEELDVTWNYANFDEIWEMVKGAGPIGEKIGGMTQEEQAPVKQAMRDAFQTFEEEERYVLRGRTLVAAAS